MINIQDYFLSITGVAALAVFISGWINTKLIKGEAIIIGISTRMIVSWVVCIGLAFLGQVKAIGIFADTNILWTIVNGIGVGLVANGVFAVEFIQSVLSFLKLKPPASPTPNA